MSTLPVDVLEQLLSLARRLTSRRDLDSVLKDLLEGSLQLIPGSDFACVFLYDVGENILVPVGGVGFEMRYMQHVRLKPGESLTGIAFIQKHPLLLPTREDVKSAQHNLTPENDHWVRLAVGRPTNPLRSSLAVPLSVGDRTVGVLVIDNYDTDRNFTTTDLRIASALADHAAIAVANAQDYQLANTLSRELQQTLSVQHRLLGSILAPSSSFTEILHTLHDVIRRPLAVLNTEQIVVAQTADRQGKGREFPIRTGVAVLGALEVGGHPLGRMELNAVEQAIPLIALEFMKHQAVEEEQSRLRADLLYRVLDNDRSALQDVDHKMGLADHPWCAVAIGRSPAAETRRMERLLDPDRMLAADLEDARVFVIAVEDEPTVSRWASGRLAAVVVWGDVCQGMGLLSEQVRGVLSLWKLVARNTSFPTNESIRLYLRDFPELTLLQATPANSRHRLVLGVLGPILSDGPSLATLRAWVWGNRSYRSAADLLHTHPNTVRYRIGRIAEQLQRNLNDDHTIGLLWLALLWYEPLEEV